MFTLEFAILAELEPFGRCAAVLGRNVTRNAGHAALAARGAFQDCLNSNLLLCHDLFAPVGVPGKWPGSLKLLKFSALSRAPQECADSQTRIFTFLDHFVSTSKSGNSGDVTW